MAVNSASGVPTLTTAGFQVLLALASGHSHGYAVMGFVISSRTVRFGSGQERYTGRWPDWSPTSWSRSRKRMIRVLPMTLVVATTS